MASNIVEKTYLFNHLGGCKVGFDTHNIKTALNLVDEESAEVDKAIEQLDLIQQSHELSATKCSNVATEVLDGAVDAIVTAIGIMYRMGLTAKEMEDALEIVADSNLSKFPQTKLAALASVDKYKHNTEYENVRHIEKDGGYAILGDKADGTVKGKILKGIDFIEPGNQLRQCVGNVYVNRDDKGVK